MKKIVAISDTHNRLPSILDSIPSGDILIHSGDHTGTGSVESWANAMSQLNLISNKFKHIVIIAGNHDRGAEKNPELFNAICEQLGIIYLCDEEVVLDGIRIYGSPYTPKFFNWAFMLDGEEAARTKWAAIPEGLDILVTHGPPYGYGDILAENGSHPGESVGCSELKLAVGRSKPKFHIFGHIHEGYGKYQLGKSTLINAAICNEYYQPINKPQVFYVD